MLHCNFTITLQLTFTSCILIGVKHDKPDAIAVVGRRRFAVKTGVAALRTVRVGLMQLAYDLAEHSDSEGFLFLPKVVITKKGLRKEWERVASVLRPEMLNRLTICLPEGNHFVG